MSRRGTRNLAELLPNKTLCKKHYQCRSGFCDYDISYKDPIAAFFAGRPSAKKVCKPGKEYWACVTNDDCPQNSLCQTNMCQKIMKRGSSRRRRRGSAKRSQGQDCKLDTDCEDGICHGLTLHCDKKDAPLHTFCGLDQNNNWKYCQKGLECYKHKCRIPAESLQKCDYDYDCMEARCVDGTCKK